MNTSSVPLRRGRTTSSYSQRFPYRGPLVRDAGLLASALARPKQQAAYGDLPDMASLAAAYTAGIVKNHPFVDGNKRTGFLVGVLFLEMNGYRFTASQETAANAVIMLAAGEMNERGYADFLAANTASEVLG